MKFKKVCILTTVHPPFDVRIFYKEAKTLLKAGYNVTLIAPHNKNEIVNGIKIVALLKPKNRFYRMFFLTRKAYKLALEEKADIYHFHDPELLPWALKLKKQTGAKIIYDVHEDVSQDILSRKEGFKIFKTIFAKTFDLFEKEIAKRLDFIITVNNQIKEKFEKKGIRNISVIANYPLLDYFKEEEKIFNFTKNKIKLVFIGGVFKEAGVEEIIKAVEILKGKAELLLIASFIDKKIKEEIKRKKELGIEIIEKVPHNLVFDYLKNSDVGLICFHPLPNYIDAGLGSNKLFEYMKAGLPVIASNFKHLKEIVGGNKCGICVNPLDPKEIARGVEYLREHPDEAKKMGENGRKAVFEKYNWENESKKLLNIYQKLCAE